MTDFNECSSQYKHILDDKIRFSGETTEYFARIKAEFVERCLCSDFQGRILDYGCGIGLVSKFLRSCFNNNQVEVFGYDISSDSIEEASKGVRDVRFTDNFGEIEKHYFDVVIMANILHHIMTENRIGFLKKVTALLKKGGYIFIFEHNPYNPVVKKIMGDCIFDKDAVPLSVINTVSLLKHIGVRNIKKKYAIFFPRISILKRLIFLEDYLWWLPLGAQYYIWCVK